MFYMYDMYINDNLRKDSLLKNAIDSRPLILL